MSKIMELNRDEITRLSRMDDTEGHAWALYVLLKKHMEDYTGLVYIEKKLLFNILKQKLIVDNAQIDFNTYVNRLFNQLIKVEIITDYLLSNNFLSIKLPIAYVDTCLECYSHH